jgi:ADP-ribosyl-[dinitrogen reductase] hydrolase
MNKTTILQQQGPVNMPFDEGDRAFDHLKDQPHTTGAVYGQIAGAFYGAAAIPARWLARLALREHIEGFAERLWKNVASGNG